MSETLCVCVCVCVCVSETLQQVTLLQIMAVLNQKGASTKY